MVEYNPMGIKDAIVFERYRYVLSQKALLNAASFRLLALYHVLATSLIGAAVWLSLNAKAVGLSTSTISSALYALFFLLCGVTLFLVLSLFSGIIAWFQYGREEASIVSKVGNDTATGPSVGNIFRWYETYMIAYGVGTVVTSFLVLKYLLVPNL